MLGPPSEKSIPACQWKCSIAGTIFRLIDLGKRCEEGPALRNYVHPAAAIVRGPAAGSKNFANVLRRTLSASKAVKRVGRGVYGV